MCLLDWDVREGLKHNDVWLRVRLLSHQGTLIGRVYRLHRWVLGLVFYSGWLQEHGAAAHLDVLYTIATLSVYTRNLSLSGHSYAMF